MSSTTDQCDDAAALRAQIALMQQQMETLKVQAAKANAPRNKLSFKVSEKGGMSIYGLNGRWPVTLYKDQWIRLLNHKDDIIQFLEDNADDLAQKNI